MGGFDKYISLHRKQRHDFMNNLQVIYGFLQLDRKEKALDYIERLSRINEFISEIYSLGDYYLAVYLEEELKSFFIDEVNFDVNIEIQSLNNRNFESQFKKKCEIINNLLQKVKNKSIKFVYLYIFEDDNGESILIANNEDIIEELSWMDEWTYIESEIDSIKIYKCEYDEYLAYRLNLK